MSEEIDFAALVVRDLMSATLTVSELPDDLLKAEADDIELAYSKLGRLLSQLKEKSCAD